MSKYKVIDLDKLKSHMKEHGLLTFSEIKSLCTIDAEDVFEAGENHQGEFMERLQEGKDIHAKYKYPDFQDYINHINSLPKKEEEHKFIPPNTYFV